MVGKQQNSDETKQFMRIFFGDISATKLLFGCVPNF